MTRAFNLGVGLVIITSKNKADKVLNLLKTEKAFVMGEVV